MDIVAAIDHWGEHTPNHAAHRSGDACLTYGRLRRESDQLATQLLHTLAPGSAPLVVLGHKEPEMLIAFLGVLKAGRAYIPVDTSWPEARVAQVVAASACAAVLTPEAVRQRLVNSAPAPANFPIRQPDDPHYIIFTSGSTGEPKGVVITSRNLATFLDWMLAEQAFEPGREVFLNQAPFSFDLSVMDLYLSLVTGGTLFSLRKDEITSLNRLSEILAGSGVTTWVSTPSFAQLCLADTRFSAALLPDVRRFLFCGETLPPFVAAELLARFPAANVWNTYGPTEATVAMTSIRIDRAVLERYPALPVGFPMPGGRAEIRDENGATLPVGEAGEIVIHGANVSVGYLGRPDLTEKVFAVRDGVRTYRTGDWGHLDAGGRLFVTGRMDGQIKLNGYRIELGDIEAHLRALPAVGDAVVLPVRAAGTPDLLAAFVVPAARNDSSDLEFLLALRAALAERLPAYMVPKKFRFVESFPMTPNGKADRRQLADLL
jgi:D-alanine--poly(phosphoribitol) ligase subunit 1